MADHCADCQAHSGIQARVDIHGKLHERIDHHMEEQAKRGFHTMIGVILCLITGFLSLMLNIATKSVENPPPSWGVYSTYDSTDPTCDTCKDQGLGYTAEEKQCPECEARETVNQYYRINF